jgi:hypothetical protein
MLKFSKVGVLIAVMAFSALLVSSAGAAEWHTNGHKAFTSTNAGASRLAVHNGASTVLVECASSTGNGTFKGPTFAGSTVAGISTVTPVFGGPCTVSGTPGFSAVCQPAALNALNYTGGTTFATAGGGVTSGNITGIDCVISAGATQCSTVTGTVNGEYTNPSPLNSTTASGKLTVTNAGQQLEVTKILGGCGALPNGTGTFGRPGPASTVTDITYVVDGPSAPWAFRTP